MRDNRIYYLDGLRGVLALIVFIHHFLYIFYPELMVGGSYQKFLAPGISVWKLIALTPINILFNPKMAINFFFLLSGYVQSYHYLKNPDRQLLQMSFIKRYFRLAIPTLAVVLLIFIFRKLHFIHKELLPINAISEGWIKNQVPDTLNFLQLIKYGLVDCFKGDRSYYQVLWTMPIELINSWMVLILLFVTHKLKYRNLIFVFWIGVQLFLIGSTHSISFTVGLLLCSVDVHSESFKKLFSKPPIKYVCLILGLYIASYPFIEYPGAISKSMYALITLPEAYTFLLPIIGNTFLFCALLHSSKALVLFSKRLFQFFGEISFMFYLTHFLLLFSFSAVVYNILIQSQSRELSALITFFLTFAVVTGLSVILYKNVDKPALRFCNRYVKKLMES